MPIKKITRIKNLAVFQDFVWDTTLRDKGNNVVYFNKVNIIYGRNYSGKTTLSRIARALEIGRISDKYQNPEFAVTILNMVDITQSNLSDCDKKVRVFNEDFVRENLRFISNTDENIVPFAILGGNSSLESEIESLKNELGVEHPETPTGFYLEIKNAREIYKNAKTAHERAIKDLDNKLTKKATGREGGIKYRPERFGDQNYNKAKLDADINLTLVQGFKPITDEDQHKLLKLLNEKPNENITTIPRPKLSISELIDEAESLVTRPLTVSGKIEELVKNSIMNKWVKEGKMLHINEFDDCAFCGSKITGDRWLALENHFDEESEKLNDSITSLLVKVEEEFLVVSNYLWY